MRYHKTVRMATVKKKSYDNKLWRRFREIGWVMNYWWECKMVHILENNAEISLKKLNIYLLYDPATVNLIFSPEKHKKICPNAWTLSGSQAQC